MAGMSAGTAYVDVVPNAKKFASKLGSDIDGHTRAIGKGAAIAGAALVAGLVVGAKKAIDAASDLGETVSKVNTVFGKSGVEILKWGDTTARSMGIGKREALDAAAIFGVFGQAAGVTGKKLVEFSKPLVQAAADLGSFHNVPVAEGLEAIRSGLSGETEPLRKFGILLNASAIEAEALSLGLVKSKKSTEGIRDAQIKAEIAQSKYNKAVSENGKSSNEAKSALLSLHTAERGLKAALKGTGVELTAGQKMLASRSLILKNLGAATGDFARTADSAANKEKINAAVTADLTAKLGAGLLPAYSKLLSVGLRVVTHFSENTTQVKVLTVAVGVLAGVLIALAVAIKIATVAALLFNVALAPVALIAFGIIVGLVALGVALVLLWKKSETFRAIVTAAFNAVKAVAGVAIGFIKTQWQALLTKLTGPLGAVVGQIARHWGTVKAVGSAAFNAVKSAVGFLIDKVGGAIAKVSAFISKVGHVSLAQQAFNAVKSAVGFLIDKVGGAIAKVGSFITKVGSVTAGPFNTVKGALSSIIGFLSSAISLLGRLASAIRSLPSMPSLPNLPDINPFAKGGIVTRPTIALIGEAGPEAVIPLGSRLALSGTGDRVLSSGRAGAGVTVENMNIRTAVDIDLVAAALYRKALASA